MNDLPFDSAADSPDDPLAAALRRLQPARCELDTAELYYRSGYAAAVADRRSIGVPPWALVASLLVVSGLSAAAGFAVGDAPAVRSLATENATPLPSADAAPMGVGVSDSQPLVVQAVPQADADAPAPLPDPNRLTIADAAPSPSPAVEQPFAVWSGWLGWPWPASLQAPQPDRLTIRPTEGQWQELVRLNVSASSDIAPKESEHAGALTDAPLRPMLSSSATEAALRDLIH